MTSSDMDRNLSRASLTSDPLGRYYTLPNVSQSLIDRIEVSRPKLVLELGSGSGSLLSAAVSRWRDAEFVTVDIDSRAVRGLDIGRNWSGRKHSHFVQDVLDSRLSEKIGLALGSVDVAVCNPPYIRPKWRADFGKILEDAGLSGTLTSLDDAGADLLFIAQNLRLLKKKGKLGLILPDGLVTAERFSRVRKALLQQHLIEQVIQLPRGVFKGTEAQTYLAVMSKSAGETEQVILRKMGFDGQLSAAIAVQQDAAFKRLDYSFYSTVGEDNASSDGSSLYLRDVLKDIVRGTVSSSEIAAFPVPVFHLGDFSERLSDGSFRVVPKRFSIGSRKAKEVSQFARLAIPGDILIARVGRKLEENLALVVHGPCAISDCIFALRAGDEHRELLYRFFESAKGRGALSSSAHGVAARFLSKENLRDISL